jgi:hypothetical protein
MARGAIKSTSHNSSDDRPARPPHVADASTMPLAVVDRLAEANSNRPRPAVVPLRERCWISVDEARQVAGEGRTRIYELIAIGKLLTKKVRRRRLVSVRSLLEYCAE